MTPVELEAIRYQAAEEYPAECCGMVLRRGRERFLLRCRNIQGELHALDPDHYKLDARHAYTIDPRDLIRLAELEDEDFEPAVFYHSHIDVSAYFSAEDRRRACYGDGTPMYPDAAYLVLSVVNGEVVNATSFRWSAQQRDFVEVRDD